METKTTLAKQATQPENAALANGLSEAYSKTVNKTGLKLAIRWGETGPDDDYEMGDGCLA